MAESVDVARRALGLIDLTDLGEASTPEQVDTLCRRARGPFGSVAAVCIWPRFVAQATTALREHGIGVATVVNFPSGDEEIARVVDQTDRALADGADEIDLVLPYRAFLDGRPHVAAAMVDAVREAVEGDRRLKVILETGSFPSQEQVEAAARLAIDHGADFIKTSTGKTSVSATTEAVRTMLNEIRRSLRPVGIKPSGGVRSVDDAASYLGLADEIMGEQWATSRTFRFGTSGLLDAVEAVLAGVAGARPGAGC